MSDIDLNRIHDIPLDDIFADEEFNCRGFIDPLSVYELAKDIKEKGLIQPISVQPWTQKEGKKWRIVAGYRRYKAFCVNASSGGPKTIPCIAKVGLSNLDALIINISENTSRANLNILQEAKALRPFLSVGWNANQISKRINQYPDWVLTRLKLLEMPDEIQKEAAAGLLKANEIKLLHKMPTREAQFDWIRKFKTAKLLGKKMSVVRGNQINQSKARTEKEIIQFQDVLIDNLGIDDDNTRLAIQCLGWASGRIDDVTMHKYAEQYAQKLGRFYPDYSNFISEDDAKEMREM